MKKIYNDWQRRYENNILNNDLLVDLVLKNDYFIRLLRTNDYENPIEQYYDIIFDFKQSDIDIDINDFTMDYNTAYKFTYSKNDTVDIIYVIYFNTTNIFYTKDMNSGNKLKFTSNFNIKDYINDKNSIMNIETAKIDYYTVNDYIKFVKRYESLTKITEEDLLRFISDFKRLYNRKKNDEIMDYNFERDVKDIPKPILISQNIEEYINERNFRELRTYINELIAEGKKSYLLYAIANLYYEGIVTINVKNARITSKSNVNMNIYMSSVYSRLINENIIIVNAIKEIGEEITSLEMILNRLSYLESSLYNIPLYKANLFPRDIKHKDFMIKYSIRDIKIMCKYVLLTEAYTEYKYNKDMDDRKYSQIYGKHYFKNIIRLDKMLYDEFISYMTDLYNYCFPEYHEERIECILSASI